MIILLLYFRSLKWQVITLAVVLHYFVNNKVKMFIKLQMAVAFTEVMRYVNHIPHISESIHISA